MPRHKQLHIRTDRGDHGTSETIEAETIEQALKDLAEKVKRGEVDLPLVLDFNGPGGSNFLITITTVDAAQEISTMGFMF